MRFNQINKKYPDFIGEDDSHKYYKNVRESWYNYAVKF